MQAVFSHSLISTETLQEGQKKLKQSVENIYVFYLYLMEFFPAFSRYLCRKMEDDKNKYLPTEEHLNPNTKFVENQIILQLDQNQNLESLSRNYKINWTDQQDFLYKMMQDLFQQPFVREYMSHSETSYSEDKKLILKIIRDYLSENTLFRWFFSEKNIHWADDFNDAMLMFYKTIEDFKKEQQEDYLLPELFKEDAREGDMAFCMELYNKTLINEKEYDELIEIRLKNWEKDRVHLMDCILMKLAICEFVNFPSIPIKVTLNEYMELAKMYSSLKSSAFINGILDNILVELKEKNKIKKTGRGLQIS